MHGGIRTGAGRKSKAEEMGLPAMIEEVIGEQGKKDIIQKIFDQGKLGSFPHQQLLMHYIYGKPQDHIDLTSKGEKMETVKEIVFRDYGNKP